MDERLKSQKTRYDFFDLPKDTQTDEEIRKTIYYKAFKLALNESREKNKIETKFKIPFWFFTSLDSDTPAQPIATISPSGNVTVLTGSLPVNTEGEVTHIGVDFLSTNGVNDLTFNLLRNDIIVSTMSQKYLFQSFPNLIPLVFGFPNKTIIKVIAYNNSAVTTHRIKMVVAGYYWYLGEGGSR